MTRGTKHTKKISFESPNDELFIGDGLYESVDVVVICSEHVRAFGVEMFELGGKVAALGSLLGFLVMSVYFLIVLFPH